MNQQFSLSWNNYFDQVTDAFSTLRSEEDLVDVTLSCEGKKIRGHKLLLSACSSYFRDIFKENPCQHPVIVFRNVKYEDLEAIIDFMYKGEVSVSEEQLESFLGTAELLEVKGLSERSTDETVQQGDESTIHKKRSEDSSETQSEPVASYLPTSSKPRSPPPKKRKHSPAPQLKPDFNKNSVNELSKVSLIPKMEEEVIVEDLTFDDDYDKDDSISHPVSSKCIPQSAKDFTGQMVFGGSERLIEEVPQKSVQVDKCNVVGKTTSDLNKKNQSLLDGKENKETNMEKPNLEHSVEKSKLIDNSHSQMKEKKLSGPHLMKSDHDLKSVSNTVMESKGTVQIPQGLTITVCSVTKNKEQTEYSSGIDHSPEEALPIEDVPVLRSEEAKTPFQEEENISEMYEAQEDLKNSDQNDSEMAAEAPTIVEEEMSKVEEEVEVVEKEPEFNYYGCETCKKEAKPVSDQFSFTHKCPICPCLCFCSHLLKEHMRLIHGWFNVKRSFQQY